MRKLLGAASFLVLSSASVLAADLPMSYKSPAPIVAPVYTWTGFYIGVHGGGGAMNAGGDATSSSQPVAQSSNISSGPFGAQPFSGDTSGVHGTGGLAGGQLGYNYQMGHWVFGVEGEAYWSGMKSTFDSSQNVFGGSSGSILDSTTTIHNETRNKYDFTIAGRMGVAFDRTLVYGKGGWAWGKFDAVASNGVSFFPPLNDAFTGLNTASWGGWLNGPLFGLGIEYLVTNNWTVKLEYNYIMFGAKSFATTACSSSTGFPTTCIGNGQSAGNTPLGADKQLFKFGMNYKFDGTLLR